MNAGKTSLFRLNFLGNTIPLFNRPSLFMYSQPAGINCNPIPGTKRDALELSLDIRELPVIVIDTAGLRKTDDFFGRHRREARCRSVGFFFALMLDFTYEYICGRSALRTPFT